MVCSDEIKNTVGQLDGAAAPPGTTVTWHDGLYTCTYRLPDGVLILSVKQSTDGNAALSYFTGLKSATADATTLEGLNGLGLPAYRSAGGTVAFVKDELTLLVDATGMPATVGPQHTERTSYAFTIASNVLACWKGQ